MVAERLWVTGPRGWTFAHGALRECLLRRAREDGRILRWATVAAAILRVASESGAPGAAERYGRQLLLARDRAAAVDPLMVAARERFAAGELEPALFLLRSARSSMRRVALPASDHRWGLLWLQAAEVLLARGRPGAALGQVQRAVEAATRHGWRLTRARATSLLGLVVQSQGELLRARDLSREALQMHVEAEDRPGLALALLRKADVTAQLGDLERALELATQASDLYREHGEAYGLSRAMLLLGRLFEARGELEAARSIFEDALGRFTTHGDLVGAAECQRHLGTLARHSGRLDLAREHYRQAVELFDTAGSTGSHDVRLDLARGLVRAGRFDESRELLDRCALAFARLGQRPQLGQTHVLLMACAARDQDQVAWRLHQRRAERLLGSCGLVDAEVAECLELAGRIALEVGDREQASTAWEMAIRHWEALGRAARVSDLRSSLASLG